MKKQLIAASIALGLGMAANVQALPLLFDPTGTDAGGAYSVNNLDWNPSGVLAVGGNAAIANFLNSGGVDMRPFTVLSHATMTGGLLNSIGQFSTTGQPYEITAVIGFGEKVIAASAPTGSVPGSATFGFDASVPTFVRIYYGTSAASTELGAAGMMDSNQLAGTGFNNGKLIFSSTLTSTFGNFMVTQASPTVNLDDTGNGDQWNGQQSIAGTGSSNNLVLNTAPATYVDSDFFTNALPHFQFSFTNLSFSDPFTGADPSYAFTKADNTLYDVTTDAGVTSTLGGVNGGMNCGPTTGCAASGADFMFSTDVNSSVKVPEPGTLALLGGALGFLGMMGRRRKS